MPLSALTIPRIRRCALALAVVLASCNKDNPTQPESLAGDYPLRTVNGFAPPQVIDQGADGVLSIVSGIVRLNENNTFIDSTDVQLVTSTGTISESEVARGSWRVTPDSIFFATPDGEYGMARNGNTFTQDFFGTILVYRR